jgi:hypothetical protein
VWAGGCAHHGCERIREDRPGLDYRRTASAGRMRLLAGCIGIYGLSFSSQALGHDASVADALRPCCTLLVYLYTGRLRPHLHGLAQ